MLSIETARGWYPASDPVHGFDHVLRVYSMVEQLSKVEGADIEILRAAALLHDADGSQQPNKNANLVESKEQQRAEHHTAAAEFARQVLEVEGWPAERIDAVQHCIRAHRFRDDREKPQTLEARILFDADKLDAIGAIGVARAIAYSVQSGSPIYNQPSEQFMQTGQKEPDEAHSAYHEYLYKLRALKERLFTPSARLIAEERHRFMSQFFERLSAELLGDL